MAANIGLWFLAVYIAVFVVAAYKAGEFQWLWASIVLWLGFGFIGARLLPGIWGITHLSTAYMPHFYIVLGSIFFFVNRWKKIPQGSGWYAEGGNPFLSLFAVSGALLSFVWLVLALIVYSRYPTGLTPYVSAGLLHLYWLEPVYWVCMQVVLMLLFYFHRSIIVGMPANFFSSRQLHAGLLLAFFLQTAFVVKTMLEIRY
ncbi:membrane protein [Neisseria arctica]|uniref:Membrane protein n=1 Tax=Neisseria arctica TaxID=1470200 RepID=A0A0J1C560_9NEIS|nr:hypothetical protein [Neisseria arctica]KLT73423.1 membrane protein [Neisseria arctica]UOO86078.1 hypothetical protein LVJ86_07565 [Neisseria arctica]